MDELQLSATEAWFRGVLGGSEWAGAVVVGVFSVLGRLAGRGNVAPR